MNDNEIKNVLTDAELDDVVKTAESARPETNDMEEIKKSVEIDPEAELEMETKVEGLDGDPADLVSKTVDTMPAADVSIFDLDGDSIIKEVEGEQSASAELPEGSIAAMAKDNYDLSDDDVVKMLAIISDMRKDNNYPVYKNMPDKLKAIVKEIAAKNNIPMQHYNSLARMLMMEFISDSEVESAFVDLERSLDAALNIPSVIDLYTEHTKKVMEENIPKMIEEIKDIDPGKAELLAKVKESFAKSYDFSFAKDAYSNNSRLRKYIRKPEKWIKRVLDEFNFKNERSNFKMNDVRELPEVLIGVIIDEPKRVADSYIADKLEVSENIRKIVDLKISEEDIMKFCILICKSAENLNERDVVDASYMYYMMKNIIVLKLTNEAKTEFAVELINNICDTITFIRNKEAEFNAANMDKSKS